MLSDFSMYRSTLLKIFVSELLLEYLIVLKKGSKNMQRIWMENTEQRKSKQRMKF